MIKARINDKVRGFYFKSNEDLEYNNDMNPFIGRIGIITDINEISFEISFYENDDFNKMELDDFWYYPKSEIDKHLVQDNNELFPIF